MSIVLTTIILERAFLLKINQQEIKLADPHPKFTPEQVLQFYSGTYPILTTSKIEGPEIINDEIQFRFITTLGTKG